MITLTRVISVEYLRHRTYWIRVKRETKTSLEVFCYKQKWKLNGNWKSQRFSFLKVSAFILHFILQ
jgi:hypothetical protein